MLSANYSPAPPGAAVYFLFEEDFVEANLRCIPMIVRFKLDACGIKLRLAEWSCFTDSERKELADRCCDTPGAIALYRFFLQALLLKRTGAAGTGIAVDEQPAWANTGSILPMLRDKANEFGWKITGEQWARLSNLQRFALLKLCKPGHENKNFPKAMKEFAIV